MKTDGAALPPGFRTRMVDDRLIVAHPDAAPVALQIVNGLIQIVALVDPYRDDSFPTRDCDNCGRPYRGPAVYCSLACAQGDAA